MPRLLRILGLGFGLAVTVGNTIGAGILRTPGDIAGLLPSPWLFIGIWVVGAVYAFLGANALSELGAMLPTSGGQFVFARHAFGNYAGFVVGWMDWISTCASTAAIALVIGESVAALGRWAPGTASPIAMVVVALFTALLLRGTRLGDRAQRITSIAKAVALLVLIVACLVAGHAGDAATAISQPATSTGAGSIATPAIAATGFAAFLLAAQSVIYTYDGWSAPIYFSEELDDPGRDIPRSSFLGLGAVAVIYLLINIAFARAVPIASLVGAPLAAGTVARALFGANGELLVRIVVIVSIPSAVNACLLMASRVLFAVSRDGLGVASMARVDGRGNPLAALVASGIVSLAFLATGTFESIIAIAAFFFVADYTLSFLAVFLLRRREPLAERPYRAVGHPYTTGVVLIGSLGFLASAVVSDWRNSVYALAIVVVSYPVFRLTRPRLPATPPSPVA